MRTKVTAALQLLVAAKQSAAALVPSTAAVSQAQQLPKQLPGAKEAASQPPAAGETLFHISHVTNTPRSNAGYLHLKVLSAPLRLLPYLFAAVQ